MRRLGVLRHRGQPGHRVQADPGRGDRRWRAQAASTASILQRPQAAATLTARARPGLARAHGRRRARRLRPGRRPPTRSTSSTPPAPRQAQGRGPRQRRPCGRAELDACATSTTRTRARCSGPPPTSAGSSGTPTSSTRPLLAGCTTVLYEGKPVGTPDAGAFWRVIAEHKVKTLFTAPTAFRAIRKEDPDGKLASRVRPVRPAVPVPGRASASTPRPTGGRASCSASRSSTTGGRPRPAGRSPPT